MPQRMKPLRRVNGAEDGGSGVRAAPHPHLRAVRTFLCSRSQGEGQQQDQQGCRHGDPSEPLRGCQAGRSSSDGAEKDTVQEAGVLARSPSSLRPRGPDPQTPFPAGLPSLPNPSICIPSFFPPETSNSRPPAPRPSEPGVQASLCPRPSGTGVRGPASLIRPLSPLSPHRR